jgi:hypothetical protein
VNISISLPNITRLTPNRQPSRPETRGVFLHSTRSGQSSYSLEREYTTSVNYLCRPEAQVSAHFVVGPSSITRLANDNDITWHARENNQTHIGIEICQPTYKSPYNEFQYKAVAELVSKLADKYKFPLVRVMSQHDRGLIGHEDSEQGRRDGKCFSADTKLFALVNGKYQFDTADNILNNDDVLLPCMEEDRSIVWKPVLWKERKYDRVKELEFSGGRKIKVTPEHKWRLLGHRGNWYTGKQGGYSREPVLTKTEELSVGDIVPLVNKLDRDTITEYDGDWKAGYAVGVFLAEGSYLKDKANGIRLSLGEGDKDKIIPQMKDIIFQLSGDVWREYPCKDSKGIDVHIYSKEYKWIINKYVEGTSAKTKLLTQEVWNESDSFIEALVRGFCDGDGHTDGTGTSIGLTYNPELIEQIGMCCLLVGLKFSNQGERLVEFNGKRYWSSRCFLSKHLAKQSASVVAIKDVSPVSLPVWDVQVGGSGLFMLGNGIISHNSDPGSLWDWDKFLALLQNSPPNPLTDQPAVPYTTTGFSLGTGFLDYLQAHPEAGRPTEDEHYHSRGSECWLDTDSILIYNKNKNQVKLVTF